VEQKEVGGAGASPLPPRPKVDPRRGQEKRALSRAHERHPLTAAGGTPAEPTNEARTNEWEKRRARKVRARKTAVHATAAQAMMGDGGHGRRWGRRRRRSLAVRVGAGDGGIVVGLRRGQSGEAPATTGSHEHIAPRGRSPATGLRQGPLPVGSCACRC